MQLAGHAGETAPRTQFGAAGRAAARRRREPVLTKRQHELTVGRERRRVFPQ
jgi:hypothetical protein